jgi:hypothetical protein
MQDRPTFKELLEAVREFLETEVAPAQTDQRRRFRTLVAINALTMLQRELDQEPPHVRQEALALARLLDHHAPLEEASDALREVVLEMNSELAARIRRGDAPPGTLDALRRVGVAKLEVASPSYLARYRAADDG